MSVCVKKRAHFFREAVNLGIFLGSDAGNLFLLFLQSLTGSIQLRLHLIPGRLLLVQLLEVTGDLGMT